MHQDPPLFHLRNFWGLPTGVSCLAILTLFRYPEAIYERYSSGTTQVTETKPVVGG